MSEISQKKCVPLQSTHVSAFIITWFCHWASFSHWLLSIFFKGFQSYFLFEYCYLRYSKAFQFEEKRDARENSEIAFLRAALVSCAVVHVFLKRRAVFICCSIFHFSIFCIALSKYAFLKWALAEAKLSVTLKNKNRKTLVTKVHSSRLFTVLSTDSLFIFLKEATYQNNTLKNIFCNSSYIVDFIYSWVSISLICGFLWGDSLRWAFILFTFTLHSHETEPGFFQLVTVKAPYKRPHLLFLRRMFFSSVNFLTVTLSLLRGNSFFFKLRNIFATS